jgi:hypothetical protein
MRYLEAAPVGGHSFLSCLSSGDTSAADALRVAANRRYQRFGSTSRYQADADLLIEKDHVF